MNKGNIVVWIIIIILIIFGLYMWVSGPEDDVINSNQNESSSEEAENGKETVELSNYQEYSEDKLALAENGDVVLFFHASWCPTCRILDADIRANLNDIPENVTILNVDYDDSTQLKQKHGVTYQHTLVQVDSSGEQIAKWNSSPTLKALLAEIK